MEFRFGDLVKNLDPAEAAKWDGQAAWRKQADERAEARRRRRAKQLQAQRAGITRAIEAYRELDHGDVPDIRVRVPFISLHTERAAYDTRLWSRASDLATRPPLTKLIAAPKSRALALYLTVLYIAQLPEGVGGKVYINDRPNTMRSGGVRSWVELAGFYLPNTTGLSPSDNKRRQRVALNTALDALEDQHLVALSGAAGRAGRYDAFRVLSDTGSEDDYHVPGEATRTKNAIRVPAALFYNGWHLVLTQAELATLLIIIDRTGKLKHVPRDGKVGTLGVDLRGAVRWNTYGLSGEAYDSVHALAEFGLINVVDPMPNRARPLSVLTERTGVDGTPTQTFEDDQRVPFRLVYPPDAPTATDPFARNALGAVLDSLGTS